MTRVSIIERDPSVASEEELAALREAIANLAGDSDEKVSARR
jgi:hypothetical protein